ncbi:TlpA disulfide reductase family protein [Sphingobacterium pedocola]|uniref:Thioredoxin domain-containing protein n=1 Tax=Sphingobacterium pedocola TaxID=2082722 RepID=A0ABR9T695_9SPHI|nr:TlpA disulfide reductase family protein [Sphingobacterium pedocola]MBE8720858.1 hypothetical protein [Sphingobacterium pedocola]
MRKLRKGESYALLRAIGDALNTTIRSPLRCAHRDDGDKRGVVEPKRCIQPIVYHTKLVTLIISFICVLFSDAQAQSAGERAVIGAEDIKPLQIGDTLSEALWNLPLRVVKHPDGKDFIRLSDYRNKKLIILDFWATWCGSCISSMPRLDSIAHELSDNLVLLAVTTEDFSRVAKFMRTNAVLKKLAPLSITSGNVLSNYFPHSSVPHIVVVDNGVVKSFTSPDRLNRENLLLAINDGSKSWSEKFNYRHQVFPVKSSYVSSDHFYTVFSGYAEGLESRSGMFIDSLASTKRFYAWNLPVYQFLTLALGRVAIPKSLIELQDGVDSSFFFNSPITYEATFPSSSDKIEMEKYILHDLMRYTGYTGSLQQKNLPCWVIYRSDDKSESPAIDNDQGITIRELIRPINNMSGATPVMAEGDIRQLRISRDALDVPLDFETFRVFLNKHGFDLRRDTSDFTMLSVSAGSTSIK